VRPVLAEKCYSCHGPKLQQSGLRVDSLAALLKGADGGKPSLVVGDPDKSPLIQVIRYDHTIKMPPQGKLPDKEIEALTQWVKMGAPWPGGKTASNAPKTDPRKHWAFQPVKKPAVPTVKNRAWVKSPVDAFILAKLERKGITPSAPADRRTLIRRAYFDLTGLPPTAEQTEAFVADKSPDAFAKVVDQLLASPQYGERWARYWLDVARYADTKGYVFVEERRYPYAYTFRDYVIRAFNEDLPYDQFLIQQIAADHLQLGADKRPLAAMGFLTVGRRFLNNTPDIIDDRIDVVFRGTQAMTVACARCHDHKFDPIPTKDYYSVYGVFASSVEPKDPPLIAEPERSQAYLAYETQLRALEADVAKYRDARHADAMARARAKIAESLLAAREAEKAGADFRAVAQKRDLPAVLVDRWMIFLKSVRGSRHPVFAAWHAFAALSDEEFAAKAPEVAAAVAANKLPQTDLNAQIAKAFAGAPPASLREVAERYSRVLSAPGGDDQLLHALDFHRRPVEHRGAEVEKLFNREEQDRLQKLRMKVDELKATSPVAPPRAMVLQDLPKPLLLRVFRPRQSGEPGGRGATAVPGGALPAGAQAVPEGQRAAGTGAVYRQQGESAHGAGDGQPRLDVALRAPGWCALPATSASAASRPRTRSCWIIYPAASWRRAGRSRSCTGCSCSPARTSSAVR
jgi:hypothetical protein